MFEPDALLPPRTWPPRSLLAGSWMLAGLYAVVSLAVWKGAKLFEGIYKDFDAKLPRFTEVVIQFNLIQVLVVGFLIVPLLIWKDFRWNVQQARWCNRIFAVIFALWAGSSVLALFFPIFRLHQLVE